ncbi:MAG: hypothetical protein MJ252_20280 [archaeon]|nr:hypothetical protein [archaeon]
MSNIENLIQSQPEEEKKEIKEDIIIPNSVNDQIKLEEEKKESKDEIINIGVEEQLKDQKEEEKEEIKEEEKNPEIKEEENKINEGSEEIKPNENEFQTENIKKEESKEEPMAVKENDIDEQNKENEIKESQKEDNLIKEEENKKEEEKKEDKNKSEIVHNIDKSNPKFTKEYYKERYAYKPKEERNPYGYNYDYPSYNSRDNYALEPLLQNYPGNPNESYNKNYMNYQSQYEVSPRYKPNKSRYNSNRNEGKNNRITYEENYNSNNYYQPNRNNRNNYSNYGIKNNSGSNKDYNSGNKDLFSSNKNNTSQSPYKSIFSLEQPKKEKYSPYSPTDKFGREDILKQTYEIPINDSSTNYRSSQKNPPKKINQSNEYNPIGSYRTPSPSKNPIYSSNLPKEDKKKEEEFKPEFYSRRQINFDSERPQSYSEIQSKVKQNEAERNFNEGYKKYYGIYNTKGQPATYIVDENAKPLRNEIKNNSSEFPVFKREIIQENKEEINEYTKPQNDYTQGRKIFEKPWSSQAKLINNWVIPDTYTFRDPINENLGNKKRNNLMNSYSFNQKNSNQGMCPECERNLSQSYMYYLISK